MRLLLLLALLGVPLAAQQPSSPTVTVTGVAFMQYAYGLQVDSSLPSPGHANNFDVTRTFVHVLGKFGDGISTRVTFDVDGRKAIASQLSLRLAYAYVSWQPNAKGPLTWKMGLMHTPWNEFEESVWDYRMQGKSVLDRGGYTSTSDFGAGVDGNWNDDRINLQAGVYNGEGSTSVLGDQGKDVAARISVRLSPTDFGGRAGGLRLSGYADVGSATGGGTRRRYLGMLSYRSKRLTLAALAAATEDSVSPGSPHQHGSVLSAFGVYNVPRTPLALLARLDRTDPNTGVESVESLAAGNLLANAQTRVIAGASWVISPHLRVLTDVDLLSVAGGATNAFDRGRQLAMFQVEAKF